MKTTFTTRHDRCNHRFDQADRDKLAVQVFYTVNDHLDVITFDEACSWISDQSPRFVGHWIGETGIRMLYYQGKRQRNRA